MKRGWSSWLAALGAAAIQTAARAAEEHGGTGEAHHGVSLDALVVQFLGFAILAIVLVVYVFPVIGRALRARSERIGRSFDELERRSEAAREQLARTEQELAQIESRSLERLKEAEAEGIRLRDEIVRDGETAARHIVERARIEAEIERAKMLLDLRNEVVEIGCAAVERVIADGAVGEAEQAALLEQFFAQLDEMKV